MHAELAIRGRYWTVPKRNSRGYGSPVFQGRTEPWAALNIGIMFQNSDIPLQPTSYTVEHYYTVRIPNCVDGLLLHNLEQEIITRTAVWRVSLYMILIYLENVTVGSLILSRIAWMKRKCALIRRVGHLPVFSKKWWPSWWSIMRHWNK